MLRTCVVIVNWNCWPLTRACLESVAAQTRLPALTVVVDNASADLDPDAVLAFAAGRFKRPAMAVDGKPPRAEAEADFLLLRLDRNSGWGGGNNAALSLVMAQAELDISAFWLLNPDTVAVADCLERLERYLEDRPEVGAAGATVLKGDGGDRLECAGGCRYHHLTTVVRPAHAGMPLDLAEGACEPRLDYVLGACMYVRRLAFEQVGVFDSKGLLYYEEADFCLRAAGKGWRLGWCRQAVVRHVGGGCLRHALPDERERKRLANHHENLGALRFAWRGRRLAFPLALVVRVAGKLAVLAWRGELYLAGALVSALRDFVLGRAVIAPGQEPDPRSRYARWRDR